MQPPLHNLPGHPRETLIHVGYPKTASSWLQKFLFERDDRGFMPVRAAQSTAKSKTFAWLFMNPCGSFSYEDIQGVLSRSTYMDPAKDGRVRVISCEGILGAVWRFSDTHDEFLVGERLHRVFPHAKILIGVREQASMILSHYNHYIKHSGTKSLRKYISTFGKAHFEFRTLDDFRYDTAIAFYQGLFGKDNVLVYPFEELTHGQQRELLERLADFCKADIPFDEIECGTSINAKKGQYRLYSKTRLLGHCSGNIITRGLRIRGRMEKYLKTGRSRLAPLVSATQEERYVNEQMSILRNILGNTYRDSNAEVCRLTGMDLEKYGYLV